jgi:hypothetical protein
MKHKPSNEKSIPSITIDRSEMLRRLANAISEVARRPNTVRMNPIWSCVECEAHRNELNPEDAKKYVNEENKLEKAKARRTELKAAFEAARLHLMEDEAVFLERTIRCLPDIWADAWTHIDYADDEDIDKMRVIASRLQFRADKEQADSLIGDASRSSELPFNADEIVDEGDRFVILNEYKELYDKQTEKSYSFDDDCRARKALQVLHQHANFPNWKKPAQLKPHMPDRTDGKVRDWFEYGITAVNGGNFIDDVFPILIEHKSPLWRMNLNG